MDVECFRLKLKTNAIADIRTWAARLNREMKEVKQLLQTEGMILESVFLEQTSEGNFLIYYLRSPDLKKAREISKASRHPLDIFHRDIMDNCVEDHRQLECLLDISSN
jgi:Family of unknown function (DUF6176)